MVVVLNATLAANAAHVVAGVHLHAGQVGVHVELDSGYIALKRGRVAQPAHEAALSLPRLGQDKVVVDAARVDDGVVGARHDIAELLATAKVERGAVDGQDATGGNKRVVGLGVGIRVHGEAMAQDRRAAAAVEVPVAVVGHVDERRRVRRAVIGYDQLVIGRELVGEMHLDRAGETLVAVGRVKEELNKAAVLPLLRARDGPEALAPEIAAAVVAVLALVGGEPVGFAR